MPRNSRPFYDAGIRTDLERLRDLGDRHLFRLRDGRPFEGWIVDVTDTGVVVADAGPFAGPEDVLVAFDDIEPGSLRYVEDGEVRSPY